jgi:hypothetical protein
MSAAEAGARIIFIARPLFWIGIAVGNKACDSATTVLDAVL